MRFNTVENESSILNRIQRKALHCLQTNEMHNSESEVHFVGL
jgi:hypothetical protein